MGGGAEVQRRRSLSTRSHPDVDRQLPDDRPFAQLLAMGRSLRYYSAGRMGRCRKIRWVCNAEVFSLDHWLENNLLAPRLHQSRRVLFVSEQDLLMLAGERFRGQSWSSGIRESGGVSY